MRIRFEVDGTPFVMDVRNRRPWIETRLNPELRWQWEQDIADGMTDVLEKARRDSYAAWTNAPADTRPADLTTDSLRKAFDGLKGGGGVMKIGWDPELKEDE